MGRVRAGRTLYCASMSWVDSLGEGRQIAVGVSHDVGVTWTWKVLSAHGSTIARVGAGRLDAR